MRVLVTFAVEPEFAPWRKLRKFTETEDCDVTVHQTQIGRACVDFVVTGMGAFNAQRAANAAMETPHTICICAGFAGALKPEHRVGDVLVPDAVQQVGGTKTIQCSRGLVGKAWSDQAKRVKMLLSSEKVVATAEEKARLAPFADAVDMESFAVLSAAHEHGISAVSIRVISDGHDQDMPVDFSSVVDEKGRVGIGGVLRKVAIHPLQLPAVIRLGREAKTAAERLAHFLEAYIKKISFSAHGWPPEDLQEVAAR